MPRSNITYAQTVIGSCGHLLEGWGAVHRLGEPLPLVPCGECSAKETGVEVPAGECPSVWVRVAPKDAKKEVARKKPARAKAKPKKPKHAWEQFLAND